MQKRTKQSDAGFTQSLIDENYTAALLDPFASNAIGCRVPDIYSWPTVPLHIKTTIVLSPGAAQLGAAFFANPYFSCVDLTRAGGVFSNTLSQIGGMRNFSGASAVFSLSTPALMSGVVSEFRFVAGGIRLRNLQPELSATGRIFIAQVPVTSNSVPNYGLLDNIVPTTTGYNNVLSGMGMPSVTSLTSAAIQQLPVARSYTASDLCGEDSVLVPFQVFHPDIYTFKPSAYSSTSNDFNGTIDFGDDLGASVATGIISAPTLGTKSQMQMSGTSAIVIWVEGLPGTTPSYEVEIIHHYEGTPLIGTLGTNSAGGIAPAPANSPKPYAGSTSMLEHSIAVANRPDKLIRLVSDVGGAAVKFGKKAVGKVMRKGLVGGLASMLL